MTLPLRPALVAAAALLPALLACGGLGASVEPGVHLLPICELGGAVALELDPVRVDLPFSPLEQPTAKVIVQADGIDVGWKRAEDPSQLKDLLDQQSLRGGGAPRVLVELAADTEGAVILDVLRASRDAGLVSVGLVVGSREPLVLPPYPDPAYGASLEARLAGLEPSDRAVIAAREIEGLIQLCPGANRTFEAVASASPEMRCLLLAHGLNEALPTCFATDSDKVVTAVQVLLQPRGTVRPTALQLRLEDDAELLEIEPEATWAQLAPRWVAHHDQPVRLPAP